MASSLPVRQFPPVIVFLNGQWLDEKQAAVSIFDRGFLYGDGLFESIRIFEGTPFRLEDHWRRLTAGLAFLSIPCPIRAPHLKEISTRLIESNKVRHGLLRLTVTRGKGPRGYSPEGAGPPTICAVLYPLADDPTLVRWKLATSKYRVAREDPLAALKTCNKLSNIMARGEAEAARADEALLLDHAGFMAEAATANIFWLRGQTLETPPAESGLLPGVTRHIVFGLAGELELKVVEKSARPEDLPSFDGIFLSLTSLGIVEVTHLDDRILPVSPFVTRLHAAYRRLMARETFRPGRQPAKARPNA